MSHSEHDDHGHASTQDAHDARNHEDHEQGGSRHDVHGGHEDHGGHGDHGHGGAGDYNAESPGPSTLPPIPTWGLVAMAAVLKLLLATIVFTSLSLGERSQAATHGSEQSGHGEHGATPEKHEEKER